VPGAEREERNVVALGDGAGGMLGSVAMKKLAVTDKGKGWAGITIRDPELIRIAERFVSATQWRGPFELEVMLARDGTYYVIEINPRFPAWVYLSASSGVNLPKRRPRSIPSARCSCASRSIRSPTSVTSKKSS
jgi:carbamoyl-phosphate synthase large subunit